MINESFKKYLAGFFDGDGCIMVEKIKDSGYTLRIKFFQSNENWIETIQRKYTFLKKTNNMPRNDITRIEYELRAAGKQIEPLVDDLLEYSILKHQQLLEAKNFFPLINVKDKNIEKQNIYENMKRLKKHSEHKPYSRLCKEYIAGLFDAEGSIGIYSDSLRVKITQKSDVNILELIAKMYNNTNKIDNYSISFYGKNSLQFLQDVQSFCIYKSRQISAAIKYIDTLSLELKEQTLFKRKHYHEIIHKEKIIDIEKTDTLFKNQTSHKTYLRNCFQCFQKLSYDQVLNYCKRVEIQNTKVMKKFENKIYNTEDWTKFNIKPVLEFCETNNQTQLYQYYRKKVSSLPYTGVVGRAIRILVRDDFTNKYIGIMCLSSDVYNLGERDAYIQKTNNCITDKNTYLRNLVNLSCCVPLQPFGYNTTGGKLIASLAFSRQVFDYYYNKYNEPLLAIVTTSINGKSIQYDRLQCLKMIGYTKGYGSVNIPDELYSVCQEYNNIWKVIPKNNRIDRFTFLKNLLKHLDLSQDILLHNRQRGIYFGYPFSTKFCKDYNIDELQSVDDIYRTWKSRWCDKRISNLVYRSAIRTSFDLYDSSSFSNIIEFKLPKIQDKVITDDLIKRVLSYKSEPLSQEQVCKILNDQYNIQLTVSDISKIYTGKIIPLIVDTEYTQLISTKHSKKKVTDEQIYFVLELYNKQPSLSYSDIVYKCNKKYNISITKGTVSDIIKGKTKPIIPYNDINDKNNRSHNNTHNLENNKNKFTLLTDEQIFTLIKMKGENKTTQQVSEYVKQNWNVYINRNLISKLWMGDDIKLRDNITNSEEYIRMISNTKKRTLKPKKFTDIELQYLKTFSGSLSECCQQFEILFSKTVTKAYISKLRKSVLV